MPPPRAPRGFESERVGISLDPSSLESLNRQVAPFLHPIDSGNSIAIVRSVAAQSKFDEYLAEGTGLSLLESLAVGRDGRVTGFAAQLQASPPAVLQAHPSLAERISQLERIAAEGREDISGELLRRSQQVLRTGSVEQRQELSLQIERFLASLEGEKSVGQIALEILLALAGIVPLAFVELAPLPRAHALRVGNVGNREVTWSRRVGFSHRSLLLGAADPRANYRQFLELCESASASIRAAAAQQLGSMAKESLNRAVGQEVLFALRQLSRDGDDVVRLKAAEALVQIGEVLPRPSPALKTLVALCGDSERSVQISAAKGLLLLTGRQFPNPYAEGALRVLRGLAKSADSEARLDLAVNLKSAGDEFSPPVLNEVIVLLEALSKDENPSVQLNAVAGLLDIGIKRSDFHLILLSVAALQELCKPRADVDSELRIEAVRQLARLGEEPASPIFADVLEGLKTLSREQGSDVQLEAAKALWNAKKDSASAAALQSAFTDLKRRGSDASREAREDAAEKLGRLGKGLNHPGLVREIFAELQGLAHDPNAGVRQHAVEALVNILMDPPEGMTLRDAFAILQGFSQDESFYLRKIVIAPLVAIAIKLSDPQIFAEALKTLGRLCEDPEALVQQEAFEALMDLANESPEFRALLAAELQP